jgi:hypothetical protein
VLHQGCINKTSSYNWAGRGLQPVSAFKNPPQTQNHLRCPHTSKCFGRDTYPVRLSPRSFIQASRAYRTLKSDAGRGILSRPHSFDAFQFIGTSKSLERDYKSWLACPVSRDRTPKCRVYSVTMNRVERGDAGWADDQSQCSGREI